MAIKTKFCPDLVEWECTSFAIQFMLHVVFFHDNANVNSLQLIKLKSIKSNNIVH